MNGRTIALGIALASLAAPWAVAAPPLPEFAKKVQLHNFAGAETSADGTAINLYRLPATVREGLNATARTQMLVAAHGEIRFVLNPGEKLENVKLTLDPEKPVALEYFYGDYKYFVTGQRLDHRQTIAFYSHGAYVTRVKSLPAGRFSNDLCRIVLNGGPVRLLGVEGDIRPPRADELPPVMISYGTSITQGAFASRADLAWNALAARALGYDFVNLGSSGSAFCEPAIAEHLAAQKWDLCVLEISVNMVDTFSVEQFRERAALLVNTAAASHPKALVVCIGILPYFLDYSQGYAQYPKLQAYRRTLEEICTRNPNANVRYINGRDLLSATGLSQDLIHPSDHGMIEIAQKLAVRIGGFLKKNPPAN